MCRLPLTTNLSVSLIRSGIRQEPYLCTYTRQCLEKLNQVGSTLYSYGWHLQAAVQINWEPKRKLLLCACLPLPIVDQYTFSVAMTTIAISHWYQNPFLQYPILHWMGDSIGIYKEFSIWFLLRHPPWWDGWLSHSQ